MRLALAGPIALFALFASRSAHAQSPDPRLALPRMELGRMRADGLPPASAAMLPVRVPADAIRQGGDVSPVWLVLAGVAGGGLGMMGGAVAGAWLDGPADDACIDFCFGPGFVLGALAGEALGVTTGVHLANGRKGSFPTGVATSAGILALGIVLGHEVPAAGLLIPASQIYGAIVVERTTGRRRRRSAFP